MKRALSLACLALPFFLTSQVSLADVYQEKKGLVVIELENTSSKLGKWEKGESLKGFSGKGYLQFTGNKPSGGKANSAIEYRFKINKSGLYHLHLHCAKQTVDGRSDLANDCYVRVEGDYEAGPKAGDSHGNQAPLKMLKEDTKIFGGADKKFAWTSGNRLDPGGHKNKRVAVYNFKAGEEYKLVISGRSKLFQIDRLVFRKDDVKASRAQDLKLPESKKSR